RIKNESTSVIMGSAQQPKKRCSHGSAYHTSASIPIAIWSGGTGLHFEEIRLSRYGPEIHRPGTPQILRSCCRRRMGELSGKRGTIGWSIRYRPFRPLDSFEKGEGIALFHLQRSFPSADLQV